MSSRIIGIVVVLVAVVGGAVLLMQTRSKPETRVPGDSQTASDMPASHPSHSAARVPAHYETEPSQRSLGATLPPEQFTGKTREAYVVARKIPQTLAQLPCYCHCDEAFGHKSLHSCFEDEHASSCAVCVDEALLAYELQTKQKMTPAQVRQKIIEKYSSL